MSVDRADAERAGISARRVFRREHRVVEFEFIGAKATLNVDAEVVTVQYGGLIMEIPGPLAEAMGNEMARLGRVAKHNLSEEVVSDGQDAEEDQP